MDDKLTSSVAAEQLTVIRTPSVDVPMETRVAAAWPLQSKTGNAGPQKAAQSPSIIYSIRLKEPDPVQQRSGHPVAVGN